MSLNKGHFKFNFNKEEKRLYFLISNAIRRHCFNYIPVYGFNQNNINILKNTSKKFNNDIMKHRLSYLPILNMNNNIVFDKYKYNKNFDYPDEKKIKIIINYENTTNDIYYLTTDDILVYSDNDIKLDMYKDKKILLMKMNKGEIFSCNMQSNIGIGLYNSIYKGCSDAYYRDIDDTNIELFINSIGQLDEITIFKKACKLIINKSEELKTFFKEKIIINNVIHFKIFDYDISLIYLLNYYLQLNDDIIFSGVSKNDCINNKIDLKIQVKNTENKINIIVDCIDKYINKFKEILLIYE